MELEALKKIIVEVLGVDTREVTPDSTFVSDLGADSLDLVQIVMGIEEKFDISIDKKDAEGITTVAEAVEIIKQTKLNK